MSKLERYFLVSTIVLFLYLQFAGILGFVVGFQGAAILYNKWPGYFIGVGFSSLVVVMFGLFIYVTLCVIKWAEKGRTNESDDKDATPDPVLHENINAPAALSQTTVRSRSEDDVQSEVSRCAEISGEQFTRRYLRDHAKLHITG